MSSSPGEIMKKVQVPATAEEPFSTEVEFPTASLKFLDGLEVSLYPDLSMSHSVMGVHYILEGRDGEGQTVAIRVTFSSRKRDSSSEPGPEFERYIQLEPRRGKPLACTGKNHNFEFKSKGASFVPENGRYAINQLTPGGEFTMELDSYSLNHLQLFYEPPYKGSSEIDL
jgi:hypothetical protein